MDVSKLQERLTPKKIKPIAAIVIVEVMLFLFSFESMLEWFNISPKLFILFMVIASYMVFVVIHYIRQPEVERLWGKAMLQPIVYLRTILFLVFFGIIFLIYAATLPEYKIIAITGYSKNQFSNSGLEKFTNQASLDELSKEVQNLIGPQYRVKVDDNVRDTSKKSRLIVVPGIFNHEKAVETIMKLEERLDYFLSSDEEKQVPTLSDLYKIKFDIDKKRNETHLKSFGKGKEYAKTQIQFTDKKDSKLNDGNVTSMDRINRWINNIKYTLNL